MSVYGKPHLLDPSSSTFSTHVTTWLAGQVKCHYQYSMTSGWRTSKIATDVITQQLKESAYPRPVPIRIYVSILIDNLFSKTDTGSWHTPVPQNLLTKNSYPLIIPKLSSREAIPESIPRSPIHFENSMNVSMSLFINT